MNEIFQYEDDIDANAELLVCIFRHIQPGVPPSCGMRHVRERVYNEFARLQRSETNSSPKVAAYNRLTKLKIVDANQD